MAGGNQLRDDKMQERKRLTLFLDVLFYGFFVIFTVKNIFLF